MRYKKIKAMVLAFSVILSCSFADPFIDSVTGVCVGTYQDINFSDTTKVLGPPQSYDMVGLGGSEDVYNLGIGGSLSVEFTDNVIYDGPGADFVVFENPFYIGGDYSRVYIEPGIVYVSSDGDNYTSFPANYIPPTPLISGGDDNPDHYINFAGIRPVFSNPENGIDPLNPQESGGDSFDLYDIAFKAEHYKVDLQNIRYIRIEDVIRMTDTDYNGDLVPGTTNPVVNGFDLDAIAAINWRSPGIISKTEPFWSFYE